MEVERPLGISDCSEVAGQTGVSATRLAQGQKENGQTAPYGGVWPSVQGEWAPSGRLIAGPMVVRHPATWHLHHRKVLPDDDWLGAGDTNVPARLVAGFTVENGR